MSENPVSQQHDTADAAQVEAIAKYLSTSRELTERLQLLREGVHETLNDQFQIVAGDLEQLRSILGDAALKLSSTFRVITAGTCEMAQVIDVAMGPDPTVALSRIRDITTSMAATTGSTIQSLQFEDMATQLVTHVNLRLGVLQQFSREMAIINPSSSQLPPLLTTEELDVLFATLERHRGLLQNGVRKAVQQQSLESGDIELF